MQTRLVDLHAQYQSIQSEINHAIASVIDDSAFIGGKYVAAFEEQFAQYIGARYCVGCANGTDALEISLRALGIGQGCEVIVPAHSWISTAEAVTTVGATPVFVDTDPQLYTITAPKIERYITRGRRQSSRCISMDYRPRWTDIRVSPLNMIFGHRRLRPGHGACYR